MIKLSFCQNDSPKRGIILAKGQLYHSILLELCLFSNLAQSTFFGTHFSLENNGRVGNEETDKLEHDKVGS